MNFPSPPFCLLFEEKYISWDDNEYWMVFVNLLSYLIFCNILLILPELFAGLETNGSQLVTD